MKNLIMAAIAFAAVQTSAQASVLTARLDKMNFQAGTDLAKQEFTSASIEIDRAKKAVNLILIHKNNCPPNRFCVIAPMIFEADLKSATHNECGSRIYHAVRDARMTNGNLIDLAVTDNTTNNCPTFVALPATEVTLTLESVRETAPETHRFAGEALKPILVP